MKMEPTLRSTQILKQEAEDIGLQGKDIAEYVEQVEVELVKVRAEAEKKTSCRQKRRKGLIKSSSRLPRLRLRLRKNKPG